MVDNPDPWTAEEIERLKQLVAEGLSYSLLAEEFGKSRSAISGKIRRLRDLGQLPLEKKLTSRRIVRVPAVNPGLKTTVRRPAKGEIQTKRRSKLRLEAAESEIAETPERPVTERIPVAPPSIVKHSEWRIGFKVISDLHEGRIPLNKVPEKAALGFFEVLERPNPRSHCRYVYGDLRDGRVLRDEAIYCGEPVIEGSPFCPTHTRLCYTSPSVKKKESRHGK